MSSTPDGLSHLAFVLLVHSSVRKISGVSTVPVISQNTSREPALEKGRPTSYGRTPRIQVNMEIRQPMSTAVLPRGNGPAGGQVCCGDKNSSGGMICLGKVPIYSEYQKKVFPEQVHHRENRTSKRCQSECQLLSATAMLPCAEKIEAQN